MALTFQCGWSNSDLSFLKFEFGTGQFKVINTGDILGRYKTAEDYDLRSEDLARTLQGTLSLRYPDSYGSPAVAPPPSSVVPPSKGYDFHFMNFMV